MSTPTPPYNLHLVAPSDGGGPVPAPNAEMMLGEHHNDVLSLAITAARSLSGPEIHGPTVEAVVTAITALARTSAELQKDGTNGDSCTCMPHLKLPCGHCPKQICEDCDRCACTCDCGTGGEA